MRHARAAVLAVAVMALAASGCGGGDDGGVGAEAPSSPATAENPTVTSFDGAVCSAREPDPPADPETYDAPPPQTIDATKVSRATLETSCGDIVIRLDPRRAPRTVNNFVFLAREGFYDGLTFHRVVRGYVIQAGDPDGDGNGGPGYTFADELPPDGYPPGAVAMANSGPGTNGSQFFVVTGDASFLPNSYSRFGRVVKGLDVARAIEGFSDPGLDPGDPSSQDPASPVWIYRVTIREG